GDGAAAVTSAEQAKTAADKVLVDAQDALKKTEAEKKDDEEALKAARTAVETAKKNAEAAAKQLTEAAEQTKQSEVAKAAVDKKVPELEPAVKPATDAKDAADKAAAEGQSQLKLAQDRVAAFEKGIPKPDPAATRLVPTITHDRPPMACRFDADGDFLFAGAQDNNLHRWDLFTSSAAHIGGHKSWIRAMGLLAGSTREPFPRGHARQLRLRNAFEP